jgi:hypothetical protein
MIHRFAITLLAAVFSPALVSAQDKVLYREKGAKSGIQSASGRIEAETIGGVKIGSRTIPSGDIVDVQYEVPALIKLDYPKAVAAESKSPAEAIKEYEGLLKSPAVLNMKFLRRQFDYKITMMTAAQAEDGGEALPRAIDTLLRFKKENPDAWQFVPLTRTLGRLLLQKDPPDFAAAEKAYWDLATHEGVPADVKTEFSFLTINLLLQTNRQAEARAKLSALPASDPRVRVYEIGCSATPEKTADAIRQLQEIIDTTNDRALKAAAYNMVGDCYRRDPKTKKDALYAFLWVDVVYNDDAAEVTKAVSRLAELFAELKDDDRARKYRERLKGR